VLFTDKPLVLIVFDNFDVGGFAGGVDEAEFDDFSVGCEGEEQDSQADCAVTIQHETSKVI